MGTVIPTTSASPHPVVRLTQVATAESPVGLLTHPAAATMYVIEKTGRIRAIPASGRPDDPLGEPVVDLHTEVASGNEQGLLGAAFSPDGRWLYVDFTDTKGDTRIRAYPFTDRASGTGTDLLMVTQPFENHNGGQLLVTPDGVLWIGLGDGGSSGDPNHNGQDRSSLLGKILRITPTPRAKKKYAIPRGNLPKTTGLLASRSRPEIWAYGLRNPWRFSVDGATMWIGDVGQNAVEEIDAVPLSTVGANFGWPLREGKQAFDGGTKPANSIDPVLDYPHDDGRCSVTGGYVYRGTKIAELVGSYVFADYCNGALQVLGPRASVSAPLGVDVKSPSSFGLDPDGELYVLSLDGAVYRLDPA